SGRASVSPWHEVRIRKTGALPLNPSYEIEWGKKKAFPLSGDGKMARTIQEKIKEALLPSLKKAVAAGQEVQFGRLGVSQQALSLKGSRYPWDAIKKVEFVALQNEAFKLEMILEL